MKYIFFTEGKEKNEDAIALNENGNELTIALLDSENEDQKSETEKLYEGVPVKDAKKVLQAIVKLDPKDYSIIFDTEEASEFLEVTRSLGFSEEDITGLKEKKEDDLKKKYSNLETENTSLKTKIEDYESDIQKLNEKHSQELNALKKGHSEEITRIKDSIKEALAEE